VKAARRGVVRPAPRFADRWGGVQHRVRRAVPAPVRAADLALFRTVARTRLPVVGPALPSLSRAANHSRLWLAIAAAVAATGGRFGRRAALRGLLAVGATSAVTNLPAKLLTGRERPDLELVPEIRRLARVPSSTSFPSGHAASAAAFATAVGLEDPGLRVPLAALAGAVAFSRVYTGVHYPGDVLVGAAVGAAIAHGSTRVWPLADDRPVEATPWHDPAGSDVGPDGQGVTIVANVDAGTRAAPDPVAYLTGRLPAARVVTAEADEDLDAQLWRAADGARLLVVVGGDGTASAAAGVAAATGVPLVVAPGGTLNHLAGDLGIADLDDAVSAVTDGEAMRIDLGVVDGRRFVNAASVGVYPHLVQHREGWERWIGKWPAALLAAVRVLVRHDPWELDLDGRPRRVWLLFVGNNRFAAEGLAPTRRRRLDRAELDVRLVDAEVPWARTRTLWSTLTGRLGRCAAYERTTVSRLHVVSRSGPLRLAADGEVWDGPEALDVEVAAQALVLRRPRRR
jgi:diacylglycerol kinase family enzyme/membrane-associated phospholipid phosphatase